MTHLFEDRQCIATSCVKVLNSVMSLPIASEKSGIDRSGTEGNETDGIEGIVTIL